ncbi:MAG: hypothetical protein DCF12_22675 [Snowella sp.]|nr:MAG: hypothetical protein DCF12_22675 [Snowella sp.]
MTNGLEDEFLDFISIGNKESRSQKREVKDCIFKFFSNGLHSSRDSWVYNFNEKELSNNIKKTIEFYNSQINLWNQNNSRSSKVDDFVSYDDSQISWSSTLKINFKRGNINHYKSNQIGTGIV